jgi:hypothetical protein
MASASGWYDAHALEIVRRFEAINPATLHGWLSGLLPDAPGTVLDIGAGSGRAIGSGERLVAPTVPRMDRWIAEFVSVIILLLAVAHPN